MVFKRNVTHLLTDGQSDSQRSSASKNTLYLQSIGFIETMQFRLKHLQLDIYLTKEFLAPRPGGGRTVLYRVRLVFPRENHANCTFNYLEREGVRLVLPSSPSPQTRTLSINAIKLFLLNIFHSLQVLQFFVKSVRKIWC